MNHKHSEYLHPDLAGQDNLALVKQCLQVPKYQNHPHNPIFDKEELQKLPDHKWMEKVKMELIHPDNYPDLIEDFLPKLLSNATECPAYVLPVSVDEENPELPKLVSLDLETTGLDKTIRLVGGKPNIPEEIVGICLSCHENEGYYIPIQHNGKDGIKNYTMEEGLALLQELQKDDYILVYHNAAYDREVEETHGIYLNEEYIDTQLLAINMHLKARYFTVALKVLGEKMLKRKMLEIKDLSGTKEFVPFNYLPAKTCMVYGCSDAANTHAILMYALNHEEKNPYKVNKFAMRLDMKTQDHTRWMLRAGLPVDYESVRLNLRTLFRRKYILLDRFSKIDPKVELGSPDQIGRFLGFQLMNAYFDYRRNQGKDDFTEEDLFKEYQVKAKELFYCAVQKKKLKDGEKITFGSGDDVLSSYRKVGEKNLPWVSDELAKTMQDTANLVEMYRHVVHSAGILASMYRYAYIDDLNLHRVSVGLKFNGTITNRYSNANGDGSLDRVTIVRQKRKTKTVLSLAESACGLNLQGVPSASLHLRNAKKVTKAPEEFLLAKKARDEQVEAKLRLYLEAM